MPIGKCNRCNRKYHYASKYVNRGYSAAVDRCPDCHSSSPESWSRGIDHGSAFDVSPYKPGHLASVVVRQNSYPGIVRCYRVRVREVTEVGTIVTFDRQVFVGGSFADGSYTHTIQPLADEYEDIFLRRELEVEIEKLWKARKSDLLLSDLSDILDIIRERI